MTTRIMINATNLKTKINTRLIKSPQKAEKLKFEIFVNLELRNRLSGN